MMYGGQEMNAAQNDIFNQKTFPENVKNVSIILGINSIILKVAFTAGFLCSLFLHFFGTTYKKVSVIHTEL